MVASVHQPSTSTFQLFDQLMLLSAGKTCYYGQASKVKDYFDSIGYSMPLQVNPAEFLLDLVNVDFANDRDFAQGRLDDIQSAWTTSASAQSIATNTDATRQTTETGTLSILELSKTSKLLIPLTLLHRSMIKSYRDVVAYGIRVAMYTGRLKLFLIC